MSRIRSTVAILLTVTALFCLELFALRPVGVTAAKSPSTVFSNSTAITVSASSVGSAPSTAATYPSTVNVSGMTGNITKVQVTLKGLTHTTINNLDVLLVSPTGGKFIFMSDAGGANTVEDRVYTFSDDAATTMSTFADTFSGTYKPTSGDGVADTFPAPAPAGPYSQPPASTFASVFNGADPNGAWTLYVVDDSIGSPGDINSGWVLTVTTTGAPASFANAAYIAINDITRPSSPYGTAVTVSGMTGVVQNLKVSLTGITHAAPTNMDILLVSPSGKGLVIMSDTGGSSAVSNVNLTFDDAAGNTVPNGTLTSGTYRPTDFNSELFDTFSTPAPLRPYVQNFGPLSSFNGTVANGDWRLYVMSDSNGGSGTIAGGWSLDVTTGPPAPPAPLSCFAPSFSPTNFSAGVNPTNVAVADLNNDNKLDLAVTNQVSNDVSIMLGNGNGTFAAQSLVTVGSSPYAIAAAKFNADNNMDLAVVNSASNNVSILLGNGDGTFSAPVNFFVGSSPISVSAGDINNDTKQDLVVANFGGFFSGSVSVLLGNGNGGFTSGNSVRTRTQPAYVAIATLNGDANKDLVVANFGSNSVSTFFGQGNGTFNLSQNLTAGAGPVATDLADINFDGIRDLIIANYNSDSVFSCRGNAAGMFSGCSPVDNYSPNPVSLTSSDYLGNGFPSFAVALSGSNIVRVGSSASVTVGQNPNAVVSADFNGDGKPDIVSVNAGSNDVSILINSCAAAKGNLFDFNADRRTDFAVFRPSNTGWYINSLNATAVVKNFGRPTDINVTADYDGDRQADIAYFRPESGLWFAIDRNLAPIHFLQFGQAGDIPVPADYDGDVKADIAVFRPSDGNWYIRRSTDNSIQTTQWGMSGDKPATADFDGDSIDDIAVYRPSTGVWYIRRSSDGQFTIRQFGIAEDLTVPADYDGDGKADIAVWRPSTGVWYVLRSSDDDFRAFPFGVSTDIPVPGDYEGDGKYDYAIWRPSEGTWYVWKSSDNSGLYFAWGVNGDIPLPSANVR